MKAVIGALGFVALLGVIYGLAFVGIIPVKSLAKKSPALASALSALHLAKAPQAKAASLPAAAPDPALAALDAQKKQLADAHAQLDKDRAAFEAQKQTAPAAPDTAAARTARPSWRRSMRRCPPTTWPAFWASCPTPKWSGSLAMLDEKKAGQVLAALPDDRAARLTRRLAPVSLASRASGGATLHTSL